MATRDHTEHYATEFVECLVAMTDIRRTYAGQEMPKQIAAMFDDTKSHAIKLLIGLSLPFEPDPLRKVAKSKKTA